MLHGTPACAIRLTTARRNVFVIRQFARSVRQTLLSTVVKKISAIPSVPALGNALARTVSAAVAETRRPDWKKLISSKWLLILFQSH